jgi:tetratricopeptide (TPR) repeat protein
VDSTGWNGDDERTMPADNEREGMSARAAPDPAPAGGAREGGMDTPADKVRTGRLTALLQQIASVPEDEPGAAWSEWLTPGAVVGRFEMVREIGRGGFGVVWEARDQKLGRSVAFKAVRAGAKAQLREERLLREAESAARLSHPNIVTLHDVGRAEQGPYLVLELLVGETLAERLRRGPLPVREAVRVAVEIAKGVAHAHAHGVVHRDLKPANVVLCQDGQVKVLDFGMAHAFGQRREDGGTPAYMAPEQREGAPEDERSDIFALGAMLFEMTSGELPFLDRGAKTRRSARTAPELVVPEAPALGELVGRMLERDPTRRPRDGAEALALLSEAERALEQTEATPVAMARARRRPRLRAAAWITAGVVVGAIVAVLAMRSASEPASAAADGRIVVAVADFANETRDPDLDGLSGLLITSLEQSKKLRVLTRGRLIDLVRELGRGDAPRIDESLARDVGRRAGVKTLLLASIQKLGDTYAAELRAVDPKRDEYLFTIREQATAKNDLLPLIDRMSDRTRLALKESDTDVKASEVSVGEAVTRNLEAYRHYFLAKDLAARVRLKEAVGEFRKALEIDPHFALAQADLAWIGFMSGTGRAEARNIVREAARNASKAPEKEAGLIRILEAFFDGRFAASRAEIRAVMGRYPDDRDVAVLAAAVLSWSGFAEEALPVLERTVRLAPDWDILRFEQVGLLAYLGRGREAVELAEAAARQRGTPTSRAAVGLARLMTGDVEGGVTALRTSGAEDSLSKAFLAEGLAAQGKIGEALATVAAFDDSTAETTRAIVLAYAGRFREGLGHLEAAARRPGTEAAAATAAYLAAAGDVETARKLAQQGNFFIANHGVMLALTGDERRLSEHLAQMGTEPILYTRLLRAVSAYRSGDGKAALTELRAIDKGTTSLAPYFHGVVAAEAGLDEEALDAFRRFERPAFCGSEGYQVPWFLARARLLMARSLERLGKADEARKILDLQLARWKDADLDLPLLADLKALRTKLGAPPRVK